MERVAGIGGYFIRAADPETLGAWYRDYLGLDADDNGLWRQADGPTVFATFESETEYFGLRSQQTMINFRVAGVGEVAEAAARYPRDWRASLRDGARPSLLPAFSFRSF